MLSKSTRQTDEKLKRALYTQIPTLQEYVLVEQDMARIEVQRRRNNWVIEKYFLGDTITFESIDLTLTVEEIYDRVQNEDMVEWLAREVEWVEKCTLCLTRGFIEVFLPLIIVKS